MGAGIEDAPPVVGKAPLTVEEGIQLEYGQDAGDCVAPGMVNEKRKEAVTFKIVVPITFKDEYKHASSLCVVALVLFKQDNQHAGTLNAWTMADDGICLLSSREGPLNTERGKDAEDVV